MPRSAVEIADEIQECMKRKGVEVLTVKWSVFYTLVDRKRIKDEFQDALSEECRKRSILVAYGQAVVAFVKDYDFSPIAVK